MTYYVMSNYLCADMLNDSNNSNNNYDNGYDCTLCEADSRNCYYVFCQFDE